MGCNPACAAAAAEFWADACAADASGFWVLRFGFWVTIPTPHICVHRRDLRLKIRSEFYRRPQRAQRNEFGIPATILLRTHPIQFTADFSDSTDIDPGCVFICVNLRDLRLKNQSFGFRVSSSGLPSAISASSCKILVFGVQPLSRSLSSGTALARARWSRRTCGAWSRGSPARVPA